MKPARKITRRAEAQHERALALPPGEDYGEAGLDLQASRMKAPRRERVKRAKRKRRTPS